MERLPITFVNPARSRRMTIRLINDTNLTEEEKEELVNRLFFGRQERINENESRNCTSAFQETHDLR